MFPKNVINWFEIPTADLDRATKFYEALFGMQLVPMDMPGLQMRMFPNADPQYVSGALIYAPEFYTPSDKGTMVYLNCNPDLQTVLDKVEPAGGRIMMGKTAISPEIGFMAVIFDTEGNRVALHSGPAAQ